MTTDKAKNIAALKRQLKSTTNATLKNALTKKIERLKQELEVSKTPAKEIAMQVRKAIENVNAMSKSDFNALIKKLAMKPEYSFLKGMTKQEIKDDLSREAKPVGWRFRGRTNFKKPTKSDIKSGNNVYYEGRPNRSDVIHPAKLAKGGGVGDDIFGPTNSNTSGILGPFAETSTKKTIGGYTWIIQTNKDGRELISKIDAYKNGMHETNKDPSYIIISTSTNKKATEETVLEQHKKALKLVHDNINNLDAAFKKNISPYLEFKEFRKLNQMAEGGGVGQYCVVMSGGSIGEASGKYDRARNKLVEIFDTEQEAKDWAKRANASLSPGEKKYYKIKYTAKKYDPSKYTEVNKMAEGGDVKPSQWSKEYSYYVVIDSGTPDEERFYWLNEEGVNAVANAHKDSSLRTYQSKNGKDKFEIGFPYKKQYADGGGVGHKVGDIVKVEVNGKVREGKITSIDNDMAQIDFGGGDKYGIMLHRIMARGGNLKPIPAGNKGLPKLPKEVRNRMGYMAEGGGVHFFGPSNEDEKRASRAQDNLSMYGHSGLYKNGEAFKADLKKKYFQNKPWAEIFGHNIVIVPGNKHRLEFKSKIDLTKKQIDTIFEPAIKKFSQINPSHQLKINEFTPNLFVLEIVDNKMAKGGGVNDYTQSLGMVKVKFSDPKYNYETNVSGSLTEKDVRDYFVGKSFNVASYPNEIFEKVVDVEFFPKGTYAEGGMMNANEENREMVMNNNVQIAHHAEELKKAVKSAKHVPAWVVAKVYEATTALSNVTHYLDGTNKMKHGGVTVPSELNDAWEEKNQDINRIKDTIERIRSKEGENDTVKRMRKELASLIRERTELFNNISKYSTGGSLKGNQHKLDMNKNGRLDSEDFKILRGKK